MDYGFELNIEGKNFSGKTENIREILEKINSLI